jgi:hypothetical protein
MLAWLMALAAVIFGVVGLLTGLNIIDWRSGEMAIGDEPGVTFLPNWFWDGAMLIFTGITAAVLSLTLHTTDHHRTFTMRSMAKSDQAMMGLEHSGAYLFALISIVLVVIGLLTGFGLFDVDNEQLYGLAWIWTGFGSGILSAALHTVRHHELVEADEIVELVVTRVEGRGTMGTATRPGEVR